MEKGNFSIDWQDFEASSSKRFKDLVGKIEFSDVTLVCGDGQKIPGHQVILATGCTLFKNLLEGEEAKAKPLIFLRGVEADLLKPLLEFLYTGNAEISDHLITKFLVLAEDFGIEGFANKSEKENLNEVLLGVERKKVVDEVLLEVETKNPQKKREDDKETSEEETAKVVFKEKEIKNNLRRNPTSFQKKCPKCNKAFNNPSNLRRHIKNHPNANRHYIITRSKDGFYHCQYCEDKMKDRSNMSRHIRKRHQNQTDKKYFDSSA